MEYKIAARKFRDTDGMLRRFRYYLIVDQVDSPGFGFEHYGVHILEENGPEASLPALTTNPTEIDELMTLLVDHLVGPIGLAEVVHDWFWQKKTVPDCCPAP